MVPNSIVVGERTTNIGKHIGGDGLIEGCPKPSIGHDAEFPGIPTALNPAVVRRGIRRPIEPCCNSEIGSRNLDRRSRDSIPLCKVPRPPYLAGDVRRARQSAAMPLAREVLHQPAGGSGFQVI